MPDPLRFLVIDDEVPLSKMVSGLLKMTFPGCIVKEVSSEDTLTQLMKEDYFDLVVTDYWVGWATGVEILKDIKYCFPNMPVIMLTNSSGEHIAVEAMKTGLDDYVIKSQPSYKRLAAAVRKSLEHVDQRKQIKKLIKRIVNLNS